MSGFFRDGVKHLLGWGASRALPQCHYGNAVFIIAHMRCGSTALSNVLCSRPEISGYGEAHITYRDQTSLGCLLVNQARRLAWRPAARYIFDKILHTRYQAELSEAFFQSRAIFIFREPIATIASIRLLFAGQGEYETDAEAAAYYVERLERMTDLWHRFPVGNRIAMSYAELAGEPQRQLDRVSRLLALKEPLENTYASHRASRWRGGGDPLRAGSFRGIVPAGQATSLRHTPTTALDLRERQLLDAAYHSFEGVCCRDQAA